MSEFGGEPKPFPIRAEMEQFKLPEPTPVAKKRSNLSESLDELAETVRASCEREEENRGRHDPGLLPVQWRDRTRHPASGVLPDPTGDLTEIARVYREIPSGHLLVLGSAGSGKTMLTLRFVQDLMKTRASEDPVPVIFNLASWDPTAIDLRDWLIERLLRDHTGMDVRTRNNRTRAADLVEFSRILPVLDGFDEIATGLHDAAVEQLSQTGLPWLLTSRPVEDDRVSRKLAKFPTAELVDLTADDLIDYLARDDSWTPVLEEIRLHPTGHVAQALRTPLMASLACTVHGVGGEDPAVLLDTSRFPTSDAVEKHLLGEFVRTVYRRGRRWDPDDAWRWLGHLARHVGRLDTNDLAWWELCAMMRRSTRVLLMVATMSLLTVLLDWIVHLPLHMVRNGFAAGLRGALVEGLLVASVVGVPFGLGYGLLVAFRGRGIAPSRVQLALRGPRTGRSIRGAFAAGLSGGLVLGLCYGLAFTLLHFLWGHLFGGRPEVATSAEFLRTMLINSVIWGLPVSLVGSLVLGVAVMLESPLDIRKAFDPATLLASNRATSLRQAAVHVPVIAVAMIIGIPLVIMVVLQPQLGPLAWDPLGTSLGGVLSGFLGALAYLIAMTAWGQWVVLSRVWLPLTGRMPWPMMAFLKDAYDRGVLRQSGASYQFRHERLRKHLADHYN